MTDLKAALTKAVDELHKLGGELPLMLRVNLLRYQVIKTYEFYYATLVRLVRSVYQGYIGGEFIDIMADLVQGQINQAYGQAWIDEGNGSTMPEYLTNAANAFILEQYGYVDRYYRDIVDARIDGTSLDPLLVRAEMWAGQWDTAYRDATLLIRTQNGGNLIWRKGQTEQGCETCAQLDGLVMSARDWDELGLHPRGYPNPQLACEGGGPANNCDCELLPIDRRRSPRAKETAMNIVMGTRKHYGPGAHPGTGTSQDVHGDGVSFGETSGTAAGQAFGDHVVVDREQYLQLSQSGRRDLVAHELAHNLIEDKILANNEEWDRANAALLIEEKQRNGQYYFLYVLGQTRIGEAMVSTIAAYITGGEKPAALSQQKWDVAMNWARHAINYAGVNENEFREMVNKIVDRLNSQ